MSIKPIDFQVSIPRSNEVSKNNNAPARGEEMRHVFSQEMQKQVEIENTQVLGTNKSEYNLVDKDGKNGGRQDQGKGKKSKKDKEQDKVEAEVKISRYDIKV